MPPALYGPNIGPPERSVIGTDLEEQNGNFLAPSREVSVGIVSQQCGDCAARLPCCLDGPLQRHLAIKIIMNTFLMR